VSIAFSKGDFLLREEEREREDVLRERDEDEYVREAEAALRCLSSSSFRSFSRALRSASSSSLSCSSSASSALFSSSS